MIFDEIINEIEMLLHNCSNVIVPRDSIFHASNESPNLQYLYVLRSINHRCHSYHYC